MFILRRNKHLNYVLVVCVTSGTKLTILLINVFVDLDNKVNSASEGEKKEKKGKKEGKLLTGFALQRIFLYYKMQHGFSENSCQVMLVSRSISFVVVSF